MGTGPGPARPAVIVRDELVRPELIRETGAHDVDGLAARGLRALRGDVTIRELAVMEALEAAELIVQILDASEPVAPRQLRLCACARDPAEAVERYRSAGCGHEPCRRELTFDRSFESLPAEAAGGVEQHALGRERAEARTHGAEIVAVVSSDVS